MLLTRAWWIVGDPATWRDLLWPVAGLSGWLVMLAPAWLALFAAIAIVTPGVSDIHGWALVSGGLLCLATAILLTPRLLPAYGALARSILGPTRRSKLAQDAAGARPAGRGRRRQRG